MPVASCTPHFALSAYSRKPRLKRVNTPDRTLDVVLLLLSICLQFGFLKLNVTLNLEGWEICNHGRQQISGEVLDYIFSARILYINSATLCQADIIPSLCLSLIFNPDTPEFLSTCIQIF
jgi:hypothetical protein